MRCPKCDNKSSKVLDSRQIDDYKAIRRRRECEKCHFRFTTFEKIEIKTLYVLKKNQELEPFDKDKLIISIRKSSAKRLPIQMVGEIVDSIYNQLLALEKSSIDSKIIGNYVLKELKKVDEVAFIRYASIFYKFENIESFMKLIQEVKQEEDE